MTSLQQLHVAGEGSADVLRAPRCSWWRVSDGAASQGLPCRATLQGGADLKPRQVVRAAVSL